MELNYLNTHNLINFFDTYKIMHIEKYQLYSPSIVQTQEVGLGITQYMPAELPR